MNEECTIPTPDAPEPVNRDTRQPLGLVAQSLLVEFGTWLVSWGAAESTVTVRLRVLTAFSEEHDPMTVNAEEVTAWLARPNLKPWTRHAYFGHLRSLFDWMRRTGRRQDDPTLDLRRVRRPEDVPRPLTREQLSAVLATAEGRVRTYVLLGLYAGLRAHEVAKIRGEDVSEDSVYVLGKGGKSSSLPTHPLIWQEALAYPRRGWWFPTWSRAGHVTGSRVTGSTRELLSSLGIEGAHHRCRHTFGTSLLRAGNNIRVVQELMRHSSLATTERYLLVEDHERVRAIASI
jgi:integrase/recombinase XerD